MASQPTSVRAATALTADRLRWRCDPQSLGFDSTDNLTPLQGTVGQQRGVDAITFGLAVDQDGFNVFVAGPPGSGRTTTVQALVNAAASKRPAPSDWCYLYNFDEPSTPHAVELPTSRGPQLAADLEELIAGFRRDIPRVFESDRYQQQRAELAQEVQTHREQLLDQVRSHAQRLGFDLQLNPMGIATIPLLEPGKPLTPEAFELLPDSKKAEIRAKGQDVSRAADETLVAIRRLEREAHGRLNALDQEAMAFAIGHLLDGLRAKYSELPAILHHLENVQSDLVAHVDDFRSPDTDSTAGPPAEDARERAYTRYRANPIISHTSDSGAPVAFEPNPTYYNLLGRIDYRAAMGGMQTDYRLIRPGALHRANGGYLILQARDVLASPFAWDGLKRALRDGELRIENIGEQVTPAPTATLKPMSIPLHVKVILIGDVQTYMVLFGMDPDFQRLFKVKAQFAPYMDRSTDAIQAYAAFIASRTRGCGLLPFTSSAVARVVEHGARLAEHQDRLATRFQGIQELLVESDHEARKSGAARATADHVDAALVAHDRRLSLFEDQLEKEIEEGTLAIDTHAQVVGQVNGLSVMDSGDYAFARPSRITARVGPGEEGVVDIEREIQQSGPSHTKGILILSGYLLEQYAQDTPLALSARVTFEQVYGPVDGDSASSAELYALMSDLAGLPVRQGIAVTGSVNQHGEVQAIGAVTTKIEGFFAVCKAQGLDGTQGVVIPATNVRHLMVKPEVLQAVADGIFNVWAVRTIDEGIEILTGVPAGQRNADGSFPEHTVHARVQERLHHLAASLIRFRYRSFGLRRPSDGPTD
jgi:predicted ATP-dependent protease